MKSWFINRLTAKLRKSINTSITNLLKRDLTRVRKGFKCYIIPLPQLSCIYGLIHFKENIAFVKLFETSFASNILDSFTEFWFQGTDTFGSV